MSYRANTCWGLEQRLQAEAAREVVAGEQKSQGFSGRHEIAVGAVAPAAELGKASIERRVSGQEHIEQLGSDVRHQPQDHGHTLGEGWHV